MNAFLLSQKLHGLSLSSAVAHLHHLKQQPNNHKKTIVAIPLDHSINFYGALNQSIHNTHSLHLYNENNTPEVSKPINNRTPRSEIHPSNIHISISDPDYSFAIKSIIPHHPFDLIENNSRHCRGIVFDIDDLPAKSLA
jgi:hypothetical protein